MLSILTGSSTISRTMRMHLSLFHTISHSLNDVINIVHQWKINSWRVTLVTTTSSKKSMPWRNPSWRQPTERQQKEIADLKDFVAGTKRVLQHETWPCLVRRNWIRWILSNCKVRNQSHPLIFKTSSYTRSLYLPSQGFTDWLRPSTYQALKPYLWTQSKVAIIGANGIGKQLSWSLSWALFRQLLGKWSVEIIPELWLLWTRSR